ncbi:MAG: ATP-binding protein [Bacteroidales bacterium]|nr:ATP-binding protein [Bacteroidales bacterium]
MEEYLIGRQKEQRALKEYIASNRSEFVVVYGRRRVGKTFLVRKSLADRCCFQITGMENVGQEEQLTNFFLSLRKRFAGAERSRSWLEAFDQLERYLEGLNEETKILFFDEMPWLATAKSDFVSALEHFWNSWASARRDIKLIVCGSAASWMLDNLINNHGGLHNRVTHQMLIEPFSLSECREYFDKYAFGYTDREVTDYYMVFGGVPYYLSLLNKEESVAQNIDRLIFSATGELRAEKDNLFRSLFKHSEDYVRIVEALSSKSKGLTRSELLEHTKLHNNVRFSSMLKELENCRFIRPYQPFDGKKRMLSYQLIDPFLHFCYHIQDKCQYQDEQFWSHSINTPLYHAWSGFAFEILCLNHIGKIKEALRIGGVQTAVYGWRTPATADKGAQIDLIIDRADHCINLCEMKFCAGEYALTKTEREKLEHRVESFIQYTGTKSSIRVTLITNQGLQKNIHSSVVQNVITMQDLLS